MMRIGVEQTKVGKKVVYFFPFLFMVLGYCFFFTYLEMNLRNRSNQRVDTKTSQVKI